MTPPAISEAVVGYLGPAGTHSHVAAISIFGPADRFGFRYCPMATLTETIAAVSEGSVGWAVVPYFNSASGAVRAVCPAVVDVRRTDFASLEICMTAAFQITHDLLGIGSLDLVTHVYSKREAFEQCMSTIARLCPKAKLVESASTAEAARLAEREGETTAAIASCLLLPFHRRLSVLHPGVQDAAVNVTRFMVVRRRSASTRPQSSHLPRHTWIVFTNSSERPVLAKLLAAAERWGLGTSAISGAVVDAETGAMRFLVELDRSQETWKARMFLTETAYLQPLVVGSPVVVGLGQVDVMRQWSRDQSAHISRLRESEQRNAMLRLALHVRAGIKGAAGCNLISHSPVSTMASVWEVLGVALDRLLNTQVCINTRTGEIAFCSVPGDRRLDVSKLSKALGHSWRRAKGDELSALGQTVGAISPLTAPQGAKIVMDSRVPDAGLLVVGSGDPTVSIVINPAQTILVSEAIRADIAED